MILKEKTKQGLALRHQLRLSWSNFLERKWRNLLISVATSIGLTGVFIAFGLGNAIVDLINEGTQGGQLPAQVQVALNSEVTGSSLITDEDIVSIRQLVGQDNIKYLEVPLSLAIQSLNIEGKDLVMDQQSYAQLDSLYQDPSIKVASNTSDAILAGEPYTDASEEGLTIPVTLVDDFNKINQTSYGPEQLLGQKVKVSFRLQTKDGQEKLVTIETIINRVLKDEFADSHIMMSHQQVMMLLADDQFVRLNAYLIMELKNPEDTKVFVKKLKANKRYRVMSQQDILSMVITFIRVIQGLLIVLSFQAILVSTVMIGIIININIMQRSREIGVMKAVGYRHLDIGRIFTVESLLMTAISFGFALLVSQSIGALANVIVSKKFEGISRVFGLDSLSILSVLFLSLAIGYIAAYLPTRKISKLDPVESLRYE